MRVILLTISLLVSTPRVVRITPFTAGGQLHCRAELQDVISERLARPLASGLTLQILWRLKLYAGEREVKRVQVPVTAGFDVWNGIYTIQNGHGDVHTTSFDSVRSWFEHPPAFELLPLAELDARETYHIEMQARILAVADAHNDSVGSWVNGQEPEDTRFSLGALIRFLLGKQQGPLSRSAWFRTPEFTLDHIEAH